jgi:hypothetical protein
VKLITPHEEGEADSIARMLMASSICVSSSSTELTNSSTSGVLTNLTNLAPDRDSIHKFNGGVFLLIHMAFVPNQVTNRPTN